MPEIERAPVLQPAIADEPEPLFDSRRAYPEQLFAYKRHGNGSKDHDAFVEELQLDALKQACLATGIESEAKADDDGEDEW